MTPCARPPGARHRLARWALAAVVSTAWASLGAGCVYAPGEVGAGAPPEGVASPENRLDGGVDMRAWPPAVEPPDDPPPDDPPPDDPPPDDPPPDDPPPDDPPPDDPPPDDPPPDPDCVFDRAPFDRQVELPLGETLVFAGDDYLAFWGRDNPCAVRLIDRPGEARARITDGRLTPDRVGRWALSRGPDRVDVVVRDDLLDADTFLNFNYSPTHPLALSDPDRLWVASPPSNAVQAVVLGPNGAELGPLVPTGSWPTALAWFAGERLMLVAETGRDRLGLIDVDAGRVIDAVPVGDEPAAIVVDERDPTAPVAYVALSGEGAVVRVDLTRRVVTARVEVGHDPRALAFDARGERLYALSHLSSNTHPQGQAQRTPPPAFTQRDVAVIDTATFEAIGAVPEIGTLLRGMVLDPDQRTLWVAGSAARNREVRIEASSRPQVHLLARVELDAARPGRSSVDVRDLDAQPSSSGPAPSPYTVARSPDGARLLVTLAGGGSILVLDGDDLREERRLEVGSDPRGLIFAAGRVWTYAWLDNALVGWPIEAIATGRGEAAWLEVGADPTPPDIKAGQRIFNDATFSRRGDFSCNNCHPDGLTDGLVWNLLLDGDVNTLPFRNVGGTDPFLWGGILPTLFDFSREVLRLLGADATGEDMQLLTRYMQSVTAPPNPYSLPGGRLTRAAERGKRVFEGPAACGACHSGPLLTNRQVVAGKTDGLPTDVPSLIGVYDTGPWGRQSQWYTLGDMVDFAVEFTGAELDAGQRDDLLAYVQQLPGDLLYLNGATPLSGSRSVWHLSPVELSFSSNLVAGQADRVRFEINEGRGWAEMPGGWAVAGRYLRYRGPALPFESQFRIRVEPGLEATLGQVLPAPVTIEFETGRVAELEVTGEWAWDIRGPVAGAVRIALLQAPGGHVSGALIDGGGLVELDHLEGFVTGTTLVIDPFPVISPFGELTVESTRIEMVDADGDGVADRGQGVLTTPFVDLQITARRINNR